MLSTKECPRCKTVLSVADFGKNRSRPDGLQDWCKICRRNYQKVNSDHINELRRENRKENPEFRERDRQRCKRYYHQRKHDDPKWVLAERKRKRLLARQLREDPEYWELEKKRARHYWQKRKTTPTYRRWLKKYRPVRVAISARYRSRKARAKGHLTKADIKHQYQRQSGKCYYCHKPVGGDYHVEHVIPLSRGGTNEPTNIVISCPSCNLSKGSKLLHEWDGCDLLI